MEITTEAHRFDLPSFDAYLLKEAGLAWAGIRLAVEERKAVREEVQRELADTGGPIEVEVEYRLAAGLR